MAGGKKKAPTKKVTTKVVKTDNTKPVIKKADMTEPMQADAIYCATQALAKYNLEKDVAEHIKKEFDMRYEPIWQVIVGRSFGSLVTHMVRNYIYFYIGQVAVLIYKSAYISPKCP